MRKKRKLIDDMTTNELMTLRKEGKSNQEIAAILDVSYNTVLRHIGKQPTQAEFCRMEKERYEAWKAAKQAEEPAVELPAPKEGEPPKYNVKRLAERYVFKENGATFFYEVDLQSGIVSITSGLNQAADVGLKLKLSKLEPMLDLLKALEKNHRVDSTSSR